MTHKIIPYQDFPEWWKMRFYEENFTWNPITECLEYKKKVHGFYPYISFQGQGYLAHRISYAISRNEDPGEFVVRHLCNNYKCSNPEHLEKGTHQDNANDMKESGRSQKGENHWTQRMPERFEEWRNKIRKAGPKNLPPNGETHPTTKLTIAKVRIIKQRLENGDDYQVIADDFGVTKSNISCIALGKTWAYVEGFMPPKNTKFAPKLTPPIVREIRRRANEEGLTAWRASKEYNIANGTADKIIRRISWKHVSDADPITNTAYERGEARWNAKLNEEIVRDIRHRAEANESMRSIAKLYGISVTLVSAVAKRQTWKHIE